MRIRILILAACGFALSFPALADSPRAAPPSDDVQDFVLLAEGRPLFIRAHVRVDGKSYRAIWDDYVTKVLKFLDTNGDGVISKKELERMPPIQFLTGGSGFFGGRVAATTPIETLDTDKDGKITRDELGAFLRKNGAAPLQFQMGNAGLNPYGARVISIGDQQPLGPEAINEAIFSLLDTNKDGKLSKEELAATPSVFAEKDANDDEMLTPRELAPNARGEQSPGAARDALKLALTRGDQAANPANSPVILLNPGESNDNLASRLLAKYGGKAGQPAKKKLKAADLGMDDATFDRLDADKDGSLDSEELAQFAKRAPDVELTMRIATKAESTAAVEGVARPGGSPEIRLNKVDGGTMVLELGVTRVSLQTGAPQSDRSFSFNFRLRDQYVNQFKMADTDNNGYLDENEASRNPIFRSLFKALDADGDGMLYEKEMIAYLDKLEELQKAVREGCVTLSMADRGSGLFELLDRDRDGRLSVREMREAAELVKTLDRDGDGLLARTEIPRNYEMRARPGPASTNDFGNVVVLAKSPYGASDPTPRDRNAGPMWFRKMDANRDGDLSRREFLGTDADFKIADADGDGLISAKEAEQAEKIWRKDAPLPPRRR